MALLLRIVFLSLLAKVLYDTGQMRLRMGKCVIGLAFLFHGLSPWSPVFNKGKRENGKTVLSFFQ
jgi:hypothetical protein